jgi:hypothetical protein
MLALQNDQLVFSFPNVHPEAKLAIEFQRTLRIPDDGKTYPLPPGLGRFPMRHVEDFKGKVPANWQEHGGVFLPLFQAEAAWIRFNPHQVTNHFHAYPFIVKVGTGKKSALTGKDWEKGIHKGDYCVIPEQPWLDGYVIEEGTIAQFVAVPLGMGITVEEQLGGEGIGGIQLEVFPMKWEEFEKRWPKQEPRRERLGGVLRSRSLTKGCGGQSLGFGPPGASSGEPVGAAAAGMNYSCDSLELNDSRSLDSTMDFAPDMGIGAGGKMKQQVFEDPYGKEAWSRNVDKSRRCFVHLANSMAWETITGEAPPPTPATAAAYERHGYPWFDFYSDTLQAKKGAKKLQGVKTVKEMAKEKGLKGMLPENKSVQPKHILVIPAKTVTNGNW